MSTTLFAQRSYRAFLKHHLAAGKTASPPLTLTRFAKALGISVASLQMIIEGNRNLTVHRIHQITAALGLTSSEAEYFENLVHFEQAQSPRERSFYERRLKRVARTNRLPVKRVSLQNLLSEWYMPSLLVYFLDSKGQPEFARIEKALGLETNQSEQIYQRMLSQGILDFSKGQIHLVYDKMAAAFPKERFLSKLLNEIQLRLTKDFRSTHSYFEAHTLNICEQRYEEFVSDYKKLLERYIAKGPKSKEAVVYQSFQAFVRSI